MSNSKAIALAENARVLFDQFVAEPPPDEAQILISELWEVLEQLQALYPVPVQ